MKTISYPLRVPEGLVELAKIRSEEERIDQSTSLRQLMFIGAEEYALQLVSSGRVSIGRAAALLGVTIHDIYRLAEKHNVRLGASADQIKKSQATAEKLKL